MRYYNLKRELIKTTENETQPYLLLQKRGDQLTRYSHKKALIPALMFFFFLFFSKSLLSLFRYFCILEKLDILKKKTKSEEDDLRPLCHGGRKNSRNFLWREVKIEIEHSTRQIMVVQIDDGGRVRVALDSTATAERGGGEIANRLAMIEPQPLILMTLHHPGANVRVKIHELVPGGRHTVDGSDRRHLLKRESHGGSGGWAESVAEIKIQRRRRVEHQSRLAARGLDRTALTRALIEALGVDIHDVDVVLVGTLGREGEVGLGLGAAEVSGGSVVGAGGFFGGVEGPEPDPALLAWVPDLGGVPAPRPLPHSPEMHLLHVAVNFNGGGGCCRLVSRRHFFISRKNPDFRLFPGKIKTNKRKRKKRVCEFWRRRREYDEEVGGGGGGGVGSQGRCGKGCLVL
ncbi:hypothetical protein PanWU01x14_316950 [Parasponia andersonii]|uniref:Uncharacterized protein n=1 Tax=Parasponia andersonii TaxID=3476 RepID=A0A2P5AMW1_PARAD|nr:hypothetical protein PanWU01x14_316950 [Parasponia andersonii]